MSTQDGNSLEALVNSKGLKVGNQVLASTGLPATASTPLFVDANNQLNAAGFPFAVPMIAGATSTSAKVFTVEGSSTGSVNELYHQTLVQGSVASTLSVQGLMRITVTDDAGNITNGDYYVPFGTLS